MDNNEEFSRNNTNKENQAVDHELIGALTLWGIAAFSLAIMVILVNESPRVLGAGFILKSFSVLLGTVTGVVGALLGGAVNQFIKPDFIQTTGGFFHLLWLKIFWLCGPQVIGLIVGVFLGIGTALYLGYLL